MADKSHQCTNYHPPGNLTEDLEEFGRIIEKVRSGALEPERFRAFRVPRGVYEQRRDGSYMLRVRIPGGRVSPEQMRTLAEAARLFGEGPLHITTRQDIQIHNVPLDNILPALRALAEADLSTKGGGGNTVRNITACPYAGICRGEIFDVGPHATALTEHLLSDPESFRLPRKYKIAFSGCSRDCSGAMVNDLGFIARTQDGEKGFTAYAGGGMGANPAIGRRLEEFVREEDVFLVAEAVKRVFDRHGNRKDKRRARLRHLIADIGFERFASLYREEKSLLAGRSPALAIRRTTAKAPPEHPSPPTASPEDGFEDWLASSVRPQKQPGFHIVDIPLPLGDISPEAFAALADLAERFGERCIRTTQSQNLVAAWLRESELPAFHQGLKNAGLPDTRPGWLKDLVACAGASTCRLGICLSRGLAAAIEREVRKRNLDLSKAKGLKIHINGCPNSCGRHPVSPLGLVGAARRSGNRLVPAYAVKLGGRLGETTTKLSEGTRIIPARSAPAFVADFLSEFKASPHYPDFEAFVDHTGGATVEKLLGRHSRIPDFEEDPSYYYDWGADEVFSLAGRGPGECSAGVFDLIEIDLAAAREAIEKGLLLDAAAAAARALLVTRGEEAANDREAFSLFHRHFVETGLVSDEIGGLVARLQADGNYSPERDHVAALVAAVQKLYEGMDQSLRFHQAESPYTEPHPRAETTGMKPDKEIDLRKVTCPLNYVKTKLVLESMEEGGVLAVLLNEAGGRNVPESARQDGHEVLSTRREGGYWRVLIRKGPRDGA